MPRFRRSSTISLTSAVRESFSGERTIRLPLRFTPKYPAPQFSMPYVSMVCSMIELNMKCTPETKLKRSETTDKNYKLNKNREKIKALVEKTFTDRMDVSKGRGRLAHPLRYSDTGRCSAFIKPNRCNSLETSLCFANPEYLESWQKMVAKNVTVEYL